MTKAKKCRGKLPISLVKFDRCCQILSQPAEAADAGSIANVYRAICDLPALLEDKSVRKKLRHDPAILTKKAKHIYDWLRTFMNRLSSADASFTSLDELSGPVAAICRFIANVRDFEAILPCIQGVLDDPDFYEFVVRVWMSQDKENFSDAVGDPPGTLRIDRASPHPTSALLSFILSSKCPSPAINRIKSPRAVALSALKRLRHALQQNDPDADQKDGFVESVMIQANFVRLILTLKRVEPCERNQEEADVLCANKGVLLLTKALRKSVGFLATKDTRSSVEFHPLIRHGPCVLLELMYALIDPDAIVHVRQLLRGGFLEVVVDGWALTTSGKGEEKEEFRDMMLLVLHGLPHFLVKYRVLEDAIDAFKQFTPKQQDTITRIPVLMELWFTTMDRAIVKGLFDRARMTKRTKCNNCEKEYAASELRVCEGCRSHRYCSKECQTYAWTNGGHSKTCPELKKGYDPSEGQRTWNNFLLNLARADIYNCFPSLLAAASSKFPGVPLHQLVVHTCYVYPETLNEMLRPAVPVFDISLLTDISKEEQKQRKTCAHLNCSCAELFTRVQVGRVTDPFIFSFSTNAPCTDAKCGLTASRNGLYGKRRETRGIVRVEKVAQDGTPYECVKWDDVDEVWARVLTYKKLNSAWEGIERAVEALDREGRLHEPLVVGETSVAKEYRPKKKYYRGPGAEESTRGGVTQRLIEC